MPPTIYYLAGLLPFIGVAIAILYAGYVSYETARMKERRALEPELPDPIHELRRLNVEAIESLQRAHETLVAAERTVRKGTKG